MSTTAVPRPPTTMPDTDLDDELSRLRLLTTQDRCDRCGAQAWTQATLTSTGGELLFCLHHGREVAPVLQPQSSHWLDESRFLNEKPASGTPD